jgi:hypothetical protein
MRALRAHGLARGVMLGSAGLLFGDLFLRWQDVSSSNGQHLYEIAKGWHGWGAFAGILLMTIFVRALVRAAGAPLGALFDTAASFAMLVFVIERMRDVGDTSLGLTTIQVDASLWPAWAGLVLAVILATSSFVALVDRVLEHHHEHVTAHAPPAT